MMRIEAIDLLRGLVMVVMAGTFGSGGGGQRVRDQARETGEQEAKER